MAIFGYEWHIPMIEINDYIDIFTSYELLDGLTLHTSCHMLGIDRDISYHRLLYESLVVSFS